MDDPEELWWCNTHQRRATALGVGYCAGKHVCDPKLGGIMMPCECVNLTGQLELVGETEQRHG